MAQRSKRGRGLSPALSSTIQGRGRRVSYFSAPSREIQELERQEATQRRRIRNESTRQVQGGQTRRIDRTRQAQRGLRSRPQQRSRISNSIQVKGRIQASVPPQQQLQRSRQIQKEHQPLTPTKWRVIGKVTNRDEEPQGEKEITLTPTKWTEVGKEVNEDGKECQCNDVVTSEGERSVDSFKFTDTAKI